MAAPLMAGNDLRSMSAQTKQILENKEVIALDQDPKGVQGNRAMTINDLEIWVKPLDNNEFAVCLLNRSDSPKDLDFQWNKYYFGPLHFDTPWKLRDLWQHKEAGTTADNLKITLQPHDVAVYRLTK